MTLIQVIDALRQYCTGALLLALGAKLTLSLLKKAVTWLKSTKLFTELSAKFRLWISEGC